MQDIYHRSSPLNNRASKNLKGDVLQETHNGAKDKEPILKKGHGCNFCLIGKHQCDSQKTHNVCKIIFLVEALPIWAKRDRDDKKLKETFELGCGLGKSLSCKHGLQFMEEKNNSED